MDNKNINVNSPEYQKMMQEKMAQLRMQNNQSSIQQENINQKIGSDLTKNENFEQSQPIERNEHERNLENPDEMKVPENFKELEREEQIALLKEYMERLSEELNEAHKQEVMDGKYEVRDISYNELNDGSIVLVVEAMKDGELVYEQFNKDLNKIDIDKDMETLRENGKLTPELEEQMLARKEELEQLKDNPERISLNELENEKTLEDDKKREEMEKEAENLGIDKSEVNGKNVEKDENGELRFKASMLAKYPQVTYFNGKGMISDKYNLNNAIGQNCDQYAIYKSENGWKFTGIKDGKLVDLTDKVMQRSGQQNISYSKMTGETALASSSFQIGFRNNNNIYWLGMGQENGRQFSFIGREGLGHNQVMAQELPRSVSYTRMITEKERNQYNPMVQNDEVDERSKNMEEVTQDNKGTDTNDLLYEEEIVREKAKEADVDEELLQELVDDDQREGRDNGKELEEVVDENIEEIKEQEQESLNDHGERDIFTEMEEAHLRNLHKPQE